MKIEDFNKAKGLVETIDNITKILSGHKLGRHTNEKEFTQNNDEFYLANFFNVVACRSFHNTGGGHSELPRVKISECKDGSGANYHLTKQETIDLQEFISKMLSDKKVNMENELKVI